MPWPIIRPTINSASGWPSSPLRRMPEISLPGPVRVSVGPVSRTMAGRETATTMYDPDSATGRGDADCFPARRAGRSPCLLPPVGVSAALASAAAGRPVMASSALRRRTCARAVTPSRGFHRATPSGSPGPATSSGSASCCCTMAAAAIRRATPHTAGTHAACARFAGRAECSRWSASWGRAGVGMAASARRSSCNSSHLPLQLPHAARWSRTSVSSDSVTRPSSRRLRWRDTVRHSLVFMDRSPRPVSWQAPGAAWLGLDVGGHRRTKRSTQAPRPSPRRSSRRYPA